MSIKLSILGIDKIHKTAGEMRAVRKTFQERLLKVANSFGNVALKNIKTNYLTGPRPGKLGVGTGNLRSKIRFEAKQDKKGVFVRFGTDVPYARIHEKGGTSKIPITRKMRAFFWAKYYDTKEPKYKWMALTNKSEFMVKIKKRPYLRPGVTDKLPYLREKTRAMLQQLAREGFKRGE